MAKKIDFDVLSKYYITLRIYHNVSFFNVFQMYLIGPHLRWRGKESPASSFMTSLTLHSNRLDTKLSCRVRMFAALVGLGADHEGSGAAIDEGSSGSRSVSIFTCTTGLFAERRCHDWARNKTSTHCKRTL